MTSNLKGLMHALRQSINEAILESNNVAAAVAALRRTGKCPVFTVDIAMEPAPQATSAEPSRAKKTAKKPAPALAEELVLSDSDVEFLSALGISDPSWRLAPVKASNA